MNAFFVLVKIRMLFRKLSKCSVGQILRNSSVSKNYFLGTAFGVNFVEIHVRW